MKLKTLIRKKVEFLEELIDTIDVEIETTGDGYFTSEAYAANMRTIQERFAQITRYRDIDMFLDATLN